MINRILSNHIYINLFDTMMIVLVLLFSYLLLVLVIGKRFNVDKSRRKLLARAAYLFIVIFIVIFAKIWISGFVHFFYALSLVSAGLVITNKETIMNFVGGLLITWRGLFVEGDHVKIGEHSGFVFEIGVFYFKILQSSQYSARLSSGKMIKVPNGIVITTPIVTCSVDTNVIEFSQKWMISFATPIIAAESFFKTQTSSLLNHYYQENDNYSLHDVRPAISGKLSLDVQVMVDVNAGDNNAYGLTVCYYCFPKDADNIQKQLYQSIHQALNAQDAIKLA